MRWAVRNLARVIDMAAPSRVFRDGVYCALHTLIVPIGQAIAISHSAASGCRSLADAIRREQRSRLVAGGT